MPRERSLASYANDHYNALIRRVIQSGKPILVRMTQSQAATLRGELYAWRRVAEANPIEAQQRGIVLGEIRQVAFRVGPEGLTALPQGMLVGPAAIEQALGAIDKALTPEQTALVNLTKKLTESTPSGPSTLPYKVRDDE